MNKKPDVRLIVTIKDNFQHWNSKRVLDLTANVVVMNDEGNPRNPTFSRWDDLGAGEYQGLQVQAHMYLDDENWLFDREAQFYDFYSIRQDQAESLARTSKRINRKLQDLTDRLGYSGEVADFLARLAVAIGANRSRWFGRVIHEGRNYDNTDYQWSDAHSLQMHLNQTVKEWKEKHSA
jgi:hypothetical protein